MNTPKSGHLCIGRRAVEVLRGQFGKMKPKDAAYLMGVPAETWKNWRDGVSKPNTDHLSALFKRFGHRFVACVMAPFEDDALDAKAARIKAEIQKLEAELAALQTSHPRVRSLAREEIHATGATVGAPRQLGDVK